MKRRLKQMVASTPVWNLVRRRRLFVLTYHRIVAPGDPFPGVPVGIFREQMAWLRRHCAVVDPEALPAALDRAPERPTVLVTFDDGYRDYALLAVPILRELRIRAVNFLATAFLDGDRRFWWDLVHVAVERTQRTRVDLPWTGSVSLDARGRHLLLRATKDHLRHMGEPEREEALEHFFHALGHVAAPAEVPRHCMTWEEARMVRDQTAFGAHTHTHPILTTVSEEETRSEIEVCRRRIAEEIGEAPRLFAYPNGVVTPTAVTALEQSGFKVAFTTVAGPNEPGADPMHVRRLPGPMTTADLAWRLSVFHAPPADRQPAASMKTRSN